jgi:hypothetical protein
MGLDLKVTIFYAGLNITICLVFAVIGHSTVPYVWQNNSLFSEATGMKIRSSRQNVIKGKCGHFIINITTLYETCLNLIHIQQEQILISAFLI